MGIHSREMCRLECRSGLACEMIRRELTLRTCGEGLVFIRHGFLFMPLLDPIELLIREVLQAHGRLAVDAATVAATEDLYEAGMTSHSSVNVMLGLEDRLGLEFPDQLLTRDTFRSVRRLTEVVAQLRAGA